MNFLSLYNRSFAALKQIYPESEAMAIARLFVEHHAGRKLYAIKEDPAVDLTSELEEQCNRQLQELLRHRPLQYVLGETWFYNLLFKVNEAVLVPRPETEELVEWIIKDYIASGLATCNILEIGTGSGCIAVALKKELPSINITAIDVSGAALHLAAENARLNNTAINFEQLDFLDEHQWNQFGKFDMIVSNPPYIPLNEKESMDKQVTEWEPELALFVPGSAALLFYEKIAAFAANHLMEGGKVYVETHTRYAAGVSGLFSNHFKSTEMRTDMSGNDRMVKAVK